MISSRLHREIPILSRKATQTADGKKPLSEAALAELIEMLAANAHEEWAKNKISMGWKLV